MSQKIKYGQKVTCELCGKELSYSRRPFTDGMIVYGYWHSVRCGCVSVDDYFNKSELMAEYQKRIAKRNVPNVP